MAEQKSIFERLKEPFNPDVIEWLPKKLLKPKSVDDQGRGIARALALCYIDARSVIGRLDAVVGPDNWRDTYRVEGSRTICRLEIKIDNEWIWKEDASGDTHVEAEKGGISGAFKRAAVKWGIGLYLYDVPEVWADYKAKVVGQGNSQKVYHNGWTDGGEAAMRQALEGTNGPRETGKPESVSRAMELIEQATEVQALHGIYNQHHAAVPVAYRAEFLRALDQRKAELENNNQQNEGDNQ